MEDYLALSHLTYRQLLLFQVLLLFECIEPEFHLHYWNAQNVAAILFTFYTRQIWANICLVANQSDRSIPHIRRLCI